MQYFMVDHEVISEFTVSHSRFITYLKGAESVQEGQTYQKALRKRYSDATHVCFAVVASGEQKASDDGEPKGTAAQPMLNVLKKQNLCAVAVTIRYFGGIKLGAGGLTAAYSKGVADAVSLAQIICKKQCAVLEVVAEMKDYNAIRRISRECKVLDAVFSSAVTLTVAVPLVAQESYLKALAECTAGTAKHQLLYYKYETYSEGGLE